MRPFRRSEPTRPRALDLRLAAAIPLIPKAGAAISCGTGTAYGALRRLNLSGNDTIAIFGQGRWACPPPSSPR